MERDVALQTLSDALAGGTLPAKDRGFAESLVNQARRGLSEKQWYWVAKLATGLANLAQPTTVADFTGVYALFNKAREHLKAPKVYLLLPNARVGVKLYVSTVRSRVPNVVNVVDEHGDDWYGRVYPDGRWEKGTAQSNVAEVEAVLKEFASNPEEVAAACAILTGNCCFCNRKLTDEKSTAVGFGPKCAEHYGLDSQWKQAKSLLRAG